EIGRVVVIGEGLEGAVRHAALVSSWTNRARDLSNMAPNELTPQRLAARAEEIAFERAHLHAHALGLDEVRELGLGAFAAGAPGGRRRGWRGGATTRRG